MTTRDVRPGSKAGAIIRTKCRVPPVSGAAVVRPRLARLIAELVAEHTPVAIYATAGAGKTTAVIQALPEIALPVAWLTVDDTDAAPGRLLTYLEAALAVPLPQVAGVASGALRQGIQHAEAAGLLAEAAGDHPVMLVLDELERLAAAPEALAVVRALLRYAPKTLRAILVSRREIGLELGSGAALGEAAALREHDLAFNVEEAADALARLGRGDIDPGRAVAVTGGWVAGVLFEAWRSEDHVIGLGGEADPLHGYLASQVLAGLPPEAREFLVTTSLLPEVTATRAQALGRTGAAEALAALRSHHLPVAWDADGRTMRCHPRFREYLLTLLERRPAADVVALRAAHGALLEAERHYEDAVEEYLRADALPAALRCAEVALDEVVERLDFRVAEGWLRALRPVAPPGDGALTRAELMLSFVGEHYAAAVAIADRLASLGEHEAVARRSERAASMMAWCYWHAGRVDDARRVIEQAEDGQDAAAIRYLLALVGDERTDPPEFTGGPLDALIARVHYAHGRLRQVAEEPSSPWAAAVAAPWRINALRALGRTLEALELYETYGVTDGAPVWFHAIVEPDLMLDLGRVERAREALAKGRVLLREAGSVVTEMLNLLIEVKLELRVGAGPERAAALLAELEARPEASAFGFIREQIDMWAGMVLLLAGRDREAARRLRSAVRSACSADRILELPTAAVLLAEAEWRLGRERAARAAAGLALDAARRQGSNHILLQALADFPHVAAHEIDAERAPDGPWHELGRALMERGAPIACAAAAPVRLEEFGEPAIVVGGVEVRPRIKKSYELLAYLAAREPPEAERDELLDALFDGRSDESARAYLRQAVHQLRQVLPSELTLAFEGSRLRLGGSASLLGEHARVEQLLALSRRAQGSARLELLREALRVFDKGEYLAGVHSLWVDDRRERAARLSADARQHAAELAFAAGEHLEAEQLATAALRADPYREGSWRLLMRIAHALGDDDGVIARYRRCERTLARLGTAPSAATRALLDELRGRRPERAAAG